MNKFKIFSFFSGSGFLDLGFELAGYSIDLVNELSPAFIKAYKYSREVMNLEKPRFGYSNIDINEYLDVRATELRNQIRESRSDGSLIGFVGGPPCPDFSIAGKQKGRHGDNGKLSLSYVNLIIAQQPDFFLFENVKGLWRTAKHRQFYEELKGKLADAGYYMTDRLTNSLEFGAAQDRDRILLFGVNKRIVSSESNPLMDFPWTKYIKYNLIDVKNMPWPAAESFVENGEKECPATLPEELTVEYWFRKNDVENHPNGKDCFVPRAGAVKMASVDEGDDSKKSYKETSSLEIFSYCCIRQQ